MRNQLTTIVALSATVLASGCGGGGQSNAPAVPPGGQTQGGSHGTVKAQLTIKMPVRQSGTKSASSRRTPKYVSSGTLGLGIRTGAAGGGVQNAPWQLFDVSPSSKLCSTDPTTRIRTCVVSVTAPAVTGGSDEFQIGATDTAPLPGDTIPMGNFLSAGDVTQPVVVGAANAVNVSLTGIIGGLATDKRGYSVWAAPGTPANATVNITATDSAAAVIFGNPPVFANPIAFGDSLVSSPFIYPSANLNANPPNYGLPPPEVPVPGTIPASIVYNAPSTGAIGTAASVTINTIVPDFLNLPNPPSTQIALDAMVVSVAGKPVAGIPGLAVGGPDVTVSVNETGAANYTITANNDTGFFTLLNSQGGGPLTNPVTAINGTAEFVVHAVAATGPATPTISVTDANGTVATLSVAVTP